MPWGQVALGTGLSCHTRVEQHIRKGVWNGKEDKGKYDVFICGVLTFLPIQPGNLPEPLCHVWRCQSYSVHHSINVTKFLLTARLHSY